MRILYNPILRDTEFAENFPQTYGKGRIAFALKILIIRTSSRKIVETAFEIVCKFQKIRQVHILSAQPFIYGTALDTKRLRKRFCLNFFFSH